MAHKRTSVDMHKFKGRSHQVKSTSSPVGKPYDETGNGGMTYGLGDGTGKLYIGGSIGKGERRHDGKTKIG